MTKDIYREILSRLSRSVGQDVEVIFFSVDEEIAIREVPCSLRDKAIIAFLFSTGVRVGEMTAMDRSNVDLLNASVTFRGEKGRTGKFRTVYLDQWARAGAGKIPDEQDR